MEHLSDLTSVPRSFFWKKDPKAMRGSKCLLMVSYGPGTILGSDMENSTTKTAQALLSEAYILLQGKTRNKQFSECRSEGQFLRML
jgi:hypothetical protein